MFHSSVLTSSEINLEDCNIAKFFKAIYNLKKLLKNWEDSPKLSKEIQWNSLVIPYFQF